MPWGRFKTAELQEAIGQARKSLVVQGTQDTSQGHTRSTSGWAGGSRVVLQSSKGGSAISPLPSPKLQMHLQLKAPAMSQAQRPAWCREPGAGMSPLRAVQPSGLETSCSTGNIHTHSTGLNPGRIFHPDEFV